ncbi:MAG: galactokinase [Pirellulales bacterium]
MKTSKLEACRNAALRSLQSNLGAAAQHLASAPGRVNLIGEHTDYNDGFVLPMAIDRHVVIAGSAAGNCTTAHLFSEQMNQTVTLALQPPFEQLAVGWANYLQGVIAGWHQRGLPLPPFDAAIASDIPPGGGLSSSAALEVAFATLLEAMTGETLDPVDKALLCQRAEHDFAGVPCGIMDQFSSTLCRAGYLMLLDCRDRSIEMIPFDDPSTSVLVIDSRVRHELVDGEYANRRAECAAAALSLGVDSLREATVSQQISQQQTIDETSLRRARHVITENARTQATAAALKIRDWTKAGQLMLAGHASLRDDFEVSCPELDILVEVASEQDGVYGARMTGGGFGGCGVCLVDSAAAARALRGILTGYQNHTGIEASGFVSRPGDGARSERLS